MMRSRETLVGEAASEFGTPCYVYLVPEIEARIAALTEAFAPAGMELSYAVKANPHTALLRYLRGRVPHLDVSSGGEIERALGAGWPAGDLSFTGPGKRNWEIEYAIRSGVGLLAVESPRELAVAGALASQHRARQGIVLRIGPARVPRGFGMTMSGRPSQFGIDEESLGELVDRVRDSETVDLKGFHIYAGTQCLSPDTLVESFQMMLATFGSAAELFGIEPEVLVFGAGFGIPYYEDSEPLQVEPLAGRLVPLLRDAREAGLGSARFLLELGRFLVGEAGVYATSVVDVKVSRGRTILVCDGGMNHHLGAAGHLGTVVPRNYRMFRVPAAPESPAASGPRDSEAAAPCDVVGPLCTSIDTLGRMVPLGPVEAGGVIGIECSGAYGRSVSPVGFISHPPPREVFVFRSDRGGLRFEEPPDQAPRFQAARRPGTRRLGLEGGS